MQYVPEERVFDPSMGAGVQGQIETTREGKHAVYSDVSPAPSSIVSWSPSIDFPVDAGACAKGPRKTERVGYADGVIELG